ncbi:MAG TPA: chromosome segregation protein SMC [Candidatus Ornithomonoglobus merdipullorum]|uniref:Chromosome partition protein Smc n=1 Tax=Candidatus Ornithomonoglobus merdipullorum TaxID=2840895 RepID=A0A9D1MBJ7_9FIRM|nr:chromosome segregation protein SMC [Candidatus Ornithomonoglobus merdipullorum]
MLLKRLELQGFKSFADKTVLDFMDGTTAVVGPNGSGKSNISDAIRWVIGETSAKSLRGSNMQDVIFTGTQTRKGVNYAEVSLVLDNSNHDFNVEFDEVVVTRRLFRSGESVYRINNSNCRLKDVHELFMDTGLGRDGYSMIGQGNVSQILSTKAEDRRSIFEEAAGVSKYKYRKEEAIKKLAHVDENLVRIGDMASELESRIGPLERQSEKARKYLVLYGDMKQLDIDLCAVSLDKNKAETERTKKLLSDTEQELEDVKSRETENERLMNELYEESRRSDEEKNEANARLSDNEARISAASNDISLYRNNIKNNNANIDRIRRETEEIKNKNDERVRAIKETEAEIEKKSSELSELESRLSGARSASGEYEANLGGIDERIADLRSEFFARENEMSSLRERANGIENLRASFLDRRAAVNAEISSHKEGIEKTKAQIAEAEAETEKKRAKLKELKETVEGLESSRKAASERLGEIRSSLSSMRVEYDSKLSKKRILEGLENDYAGYAKSVKAVLTAKELKGISMYGTVSGLADVDRRYVLAIETALGGALQNIIVESEQDAKAAIAYLRKTRGGRATFLPVSSVKGRGLENTAEVSKSQGFIGIASQLVKHDRRYDGIFASLLGRVVVVDNIDNAIALSRKFGYRFKTVTLDGDVLNAGGSMSGGSVNKQSGFLSRAAEIKELTSETAELARSIKALTEEGKGAEGDLSLAENQLGSFVPLVREYEDELLRLENTKKMLVESLERSESTSYEAELAQIEEQLKETADEVAKLIAGVSSLKTKNTELEKEIESVTEKRSEMLEKRSESDAQADEIASEMTELRSSIAVMRQSISSAYAEINGSKDETARRAAEAEELLRLNSEYEKSIEEKTAVLESSRELSEKIKSRLGEIDEKKRMITDKMSRSRGANKDITNRIIELQREISRIENRCVRLETDRDNTLSRIWDDYELSYNDLSEQRREIENMSEASEQLASLKKKIKALGSVNMDSIEEYKNVKERYEFMTGQKVDLEKSRNDLTEIISSMEELIKEHFSEQFKEINKAFKEVFTELFGGGSGELRLSDDQNILTSGIEIEVQLPGKGKQNINLYSGGEKSFIAIALLFAILRVKPPPFCILDEIDAALDDVNVSRFATYLKNYTDRTQFIVITHRRGTMEAASILYGVTMQESGVSKLLSLKIDDVSDELVN